MYDLALQEPVDFPDLPNCLLQIAHSYLYFKDYESAIPILKKTTQYKNTLFSNNDIMSAMNSLGICYREQGKRDSSDYYFRKVLNAKDAIRYFEWEGIAKANLGYNLILEGKPEQAIPLLEFGIERAKQYNDYGTAVSASLRLADVYLSLRKPEQAKPYIEDVKTIFRLQPDYRSDHLFYPILSRYYVLTGDNKRAIVYMDSATLAQKINTEKFDALVLLRIEQKETAQKKAELEQEKAQKQRSQTRLRWAVGVSVFFLCLLVLYYILYTQKKQAYRKLVSRSQEWARMPVIVPKEEMYVSPDAENPIGNEEIAKDKEEQFELVRKMCDLLEKEALYKKPDLTISMLAELLDINKINLSKAGNSFFGKNFKSFINEYRIKEAIRLMEDPAYENESIDMIACDSGFNDRTTFFRAFKKETGISPSVFRKNSLSPSGENSQGVAIGE